MTKIKAKAVSKAAIVKVAEKEDKELMKILLHEDKLYTLDEAVKLITKWRNKGVNS